MCAVMRCICSVIRHTPSVCNCLNECPSRSGRPGLPDRPRCSQIVPDSILMVPLIRLSSSSTAWDGPCSQIGCRVPLAASTKRTPCRVLKSPRQLGLQHVSTLLSNVLAGRCAGDRVQIMQSSGWGRWGSPRLPTFPTPIPSVPTHSPE